VIPDRADANAIWSSGRWYTYRDLAARSGAVAALVLAEARPRAIARPIIPLLADNSFLLAAAYLGVVRAGAIPALVPLLSTDALAAIVAEIDSDLALADPDKLDRLRAAGARRALPLDLTLADADATAAAGDGDELALLLYTSGSTGRPCGVMLSRNNLAFNTHAILSAAPVASDERSIVTLPLHYCYGLSVLHTHVARGAAVVFPPRADLGALLAVIDEVDPTGLPTVPHLVHTWLHHGDAAARRRLAQLRYVMVSGGKLSDDDVRVLIDEAPRMRIYIRYGITETTAAASILAPDRLADRIGSIGTGLPGAPLLVRGDDGRPVAPGSDDVGEIVVRGPHVALGYLHGGPGGFSGGAYCSGDRARVDADGFVYVVGRTQSFVKTAGHRVAVEEVEEVLARYPDVAAAAVCGIPHPTRGDALVALVVAQHGHTISAIDLRAHCAASLPAFKVPVEFRAVDALPRTASGKLDRREIASRARTPRTPTSPE